VKKIWLICGSLSKDWKKQGRLTFGFYAQKRDRLKERTILRKYGIDNVEGHHYHQIINILPKLEDGDRLLEKDVLWLSTKRYFFRYPEIKWKFHKNEAEFYRRCFEKTNDPWQAVNASSHYRKANLPQKALKVLSKIDVTSQRNKHLRSALCTTKGGCKRDLRQFDEAIQLAQTAHSLDPDSFHPCTLLGALNYDIGNHILGDEWFAKAVSRGASSDAVDHEIRSIFRRADEAKQEQLKRHLLRVDPVRYSWVNRLNRGKKGNGKKKP
jgi:tetratricopeptide (TPR) repeat protein